MRHSISTFADGELGVYLLLASPEGRILYANDALVQALIGQAYAESWDETRSEALCAALAPTPEPFALRDLPKTFSTTHRHIDGDPLTITWHCRQVLASERSPARIESVGVESPDTRRYAARARVGGGEVGTEAWHGLETRRMLIERIALALWRTRNESSVSPVVMYIDLDRFKAINDTYGNDVGNHVLQQIGERIIVALAEIDGRAHVAHLGRDEFGVLLQGVGSAETASQIASRIDESIRHPVQTASGDIVLAASIGIALDDAETKTPEDLLRNAETAMMRAKRGLSHGQWLFQPKLHQEVVRRQRLGMDLRRAIENEQIDLQYQPIVSFRNGRVVSAEALARWTHPEQGPISPMEFVAIAEDNGLIVPLGLLVLKKACRQMRTWLDRGLRPLPVSVNVSARQFRDPHFVDLVRAALVDQSLEPWMLKLEVTESTAADDPESVIYILGLLKDMGIEILLDDFGTGYSSLSYLTRLPLDRLKIDRSFVRNVPACPHDTSVTSTIVAMAKSLALGLIAEGVETQEQLEFLADLGCDEVQGYLFSKPVPAGELERMLADDFQFPIRSNAFPPWAAASEQPPRIGNGPRVLFVDDEHRVLEGLRLTLRHKSEDWQIEFADSGSEALTLIAQRPFDVLVADLRMPGLSGGQLLERVQQLSPGTVRMVLTAHADLEAAARLVPIAHRFLMKPCSSAVIVDAVDRAAHLRAKLRAPEIQALVGRIGELPIVPALFSKLSLLLDSPKWTLDQLIALVKEDVALSAKVLQLVNSSFVVPGRSIAGIAEAVGYLGAGALRRLVLSRGTIGSSDTRRDELEKTVETLQRHSLLTAHIAGQLAPPALAEDAFTAAMLHDIGLLVLATQHPEKFSEAVRLTLIRGIPLHLAEQQVIGATHAEVGAYLLGLWGLPGTVVEAVLEHHDIDRQSTGLADVANLVRIADVLACRAEPWSYLDSIRATLQAHAQRHLDSEAIRPEWLSLARSVSASLPPV